MLDNYARIVYRFKWWILAIALAGMAGGGFFASGVYGSLTQGGFAVPGSASTQAASIVGEKFGGGRDSLVLLFSSDHLSVDTAAFREAEQGVLNTVQKPRAVTSVASYYSTNDPQFVSRDRHQSYAVVGLRGSSDQQATELQQLQPVLRSTVLRVQAGGAAAVNAASTAYVKQDLTKAEYITFPITAVLLIVIFRSLAAAAMPLAVGIYGIIGALVITRLVSYATDMSVYVLNLITLLGLGLAIDYSLFIVSRFREELKNNEDEQTALIRTLCTAGRTVLFSGLTVMIALAGLVVFPVGYLRSMGVGGSAAVLVAMVGALFFLPAMLGIMGTTVNALHVASLLPRHVRQRPSGPGVWATICHRVMRWPLATVGVTLACVLVAGIPFLHVHFTNPDYRILPRSSDVYAVGRALTHDFAAGDKAPIQVVLHTAGSMVEGQSLTSLYAYVTRLEALPGVQAVRSLVSLPTVSGANAYRQLYTPPLSPLAQTALAQYRSGPYTLVEVIPSSATYDRSTEDLVTRLRAITVHGFTLNVGGQTAELVDLLHSIAHYGIYAVVIIIGAMLILFFLMLGSIVIPLKTIILNVLSLSAAFGALVWIFQMGHLSSWLHITPEGGIDATQPVIIFSLAFGLSMDYAIFLFSRVKEHFSEHANVEQAIAWGVQRTGGIITSAALLLLVVIGAFASGRIVVMKEVGIGLMVAIVVDVFFVRLLLVPASMKLLDTYNWWAPAPLRKLHDKLGIKDTD
ncbi:MAG TPA: MMPL family transporter [Candidatus Saccharimonadales bacterium]|nr:MMPL family transporter [Candidatus Saccharimonadales bacterium]